ncbi:hypothetical protein J6590_107363, partial [Homalodisca vitripennis]
MEHSLSSHYNAANGAVQKLRYKTSYYNKILHVQRLSQDHSIKQYRAWLLGCMTAERSSVLTSSPPTRPLVVVQKSPLNRWFPGCIREGSQ